MITSTAIGRLTKDPETRAVNGTTVTVGALASDNFGKDAGATFRSFEIWGNRGEVFAQYHSKGDVVFVSGTEEDDRWEKDGQSRTKPKIRVSNWTFVPKPPAGNNDDNQGDIPF